jgi:hypothetical protein
MFNVVETGVHVIQKWSCRPESGVVWDVRLALVLVGMAWIGLAGGHLVPWLRKRDIHRWDGGLADCIFCALAFGMLQLLMALGEVSIR